jgi:hypothetical protein
MPGREAQPLRPQRKGELRQQVQTLPGHTVVALEIHEFRVHAGLQSEGESGPLAHRDELRHALVGTIVARDRFVQRLEVLHASEDSPRVVVPVEIDPSFEVRDAAALRLLPRSWKYVPSDVRADVRRQRRRVAEVRHVLEAREAAVRAELVVVWAGIRDRGSPRCSS